MAMPTVWGTDVELFCAVNWLQTDICVLKDDKWHRSFHKGFNSKRGKNTLSLLNLYLENSCCHYEPIISVIPKSD